MNIFEQELQRLAKVCEGIKNPVFAGRACYGDLGDDNRVKLQFVTLGHADHYEALKATVLNRKDGEVDALVFRFSDIWGNKPVSNPNFRDGVKPHIWTSGNKTEWYAYKPTDADFRQLGKTVGAYLDVFTAHSLVPQNTQSVDSVVKKLREAKQSPAAEKKPACKKSGPAL